MHTRGSQDVGWYNHCLLCTWMSSRVALEPLFVAVKEGCRILPELKLVQLTLRVYMYMQEQQEQADIP